MKHISILVPTGAVLGSIEGPRQVFTEANKFSINIGKPGFCKIQLVGLTKEVPAAGGKYTVNTDAVLSEILKTDLIIIPALDGDMIKILEENKEFLPWIVEQHNAGAEVASLCVGAFMLASTGLLDGKNCSTHWNYANKFRTLYPNVNLQTDELITDENGIYTNGGAYSFLNLVLYLVEKYYDRKTAIFCSKVFQIEMDRQSQSPFIIFKGQKQHNDEMVKEAQAYIENSLTERISIESLSSKFSVGRRNFDRRFIKATGNTPIEYAQRVKVESAKKSLETTRKSINEVMYEVGYADMKAFREVFRRFTGVSPLTYKTKYNKDGANI